MSEASIRKETGKTAVGDCCENQSRRIEWIDVAKFVCAFFVVFHHVAAMLPFALRRPISATLFWDHISVPCFFFLSALFVRPTSRFLNTKRAIKLLIPTLFWALIGAIIMQEFKPCELNSWLKTFGIISFYNGPLWFMVYLALFSLFSPLLTKISIGWSISLFAILSILGEFHFKPYPFQCYLAGIVVGRLLTIPTLTDYLRKLYPFVLVTAAAVPLILLVTEGTNNIVLYVPPVTRYFGILNVCCLAVMLTVRLPRVAALFAKWGKVSFLVYVAHWPILVIFQRMGSDLPVWLGTLLPFIVVGIFTYAALFISKYFPKTSEILLMVKR